MRRAPLRRHLRGEKGSRGEGRKSPASRVPDLMAGLRAELARKKQKRGSKGKEGRSRH